MTTLTYLLVGSVFLGTQILAIDLGIAKLSIYRLMLAILGGLFFILIKNNDPRVKFYRNKLSDYYVWFHAIWFIYAIISVIWVQDMIGWLKSVFFIGTGMFSVLFIKTFINTKQEVLRLYNVLFAMITMHNLIGWYEIITGNYWFADLEKLDRYDTFDTQPFTRIPISIYANQNDYATLLTLGFFILFILFWYVKNRHLKIGYFTVMLSTTYLIFRTLSRANILGLMLGLGVMLLVKIAPLVREFLMRKNVRRAIIVLSLLTVSILLSMDSVKEFVLTLLTDNQYVDANIRSSNYNRIYLLLNGIHFLVQTFGLGVGAGNIEYWMSNYALYPIFGIINIHNWWGEILVAYGIMIFTLYVTVYVTMFIQLYRRYNRTESRFIKISSLSFIGFLGAFVISSVSSSSMIPAEWQWMYWGSIIAFIQYSERYEKKFFATTSLKDNITLKTQSWRVENG